MSIKDKWSDSDSQKFVKKYIQEGINEDLAWDDILSTIIRF